MSLRTHVDLRTAFRTSTVLRSRDLTALGISRGQIADSTKRGVIQRIGRGLYTIENAKITEKHSYVQVAKMVPHGVLCLLSACRIHGITTQNPRDVWFALEPKAWAPKITFVRTRLQRFSGPAFSEGIETIRCEGMDLRVYSVAKTVTDLFRLRNKIGLDIALEALRDALKQKKCTTRELMHFARLRHVAKVIEPYLTAYTAS